MKIQQITAVLEPDVASHGIVYGLGDDQQIYFWNPDSACWLVYSKKFD